MTDKNNSNTTSSVLNIYLEGEQLEMIRAEATAIGVSMTKLMRDYTTAYLRMTKEARLAEAGNLQHPSSAYTQLLNIDARLDKQIEELAVLIKEGNDQSRSLLNILAVFIKVWLNHTEEVPEALRDVRSQVTEIRLKRFARLVAKAERTLSVPFQSAIMDAMDMLLEEEAQNAK
jgi:hypothetical protein